MGRTFGENMTCYFDFITIQSRPDSSMKPQGHQVVEESVRQVRLWVRVPVPLRDDFQGDLAEFVHATLPGFMGCADAVVMYSGDIQEDRFERGVEKITKWAEEWLRCRNGRAAFQTVAG